MLMIIITGASSNHFKTMINFITSFEKYNIKNKHKLLIYDLGLNTEELDILQNLENKYKIEKFNYKIYPSYFNIDINAGEYAWKPIIIYNVYKIYGGNIIWLDAGTIINNNFDEFEKILLNDYIYTPVSPGNIEKWTHIKTLEYLKWNNLTLLNRSGGCCGFNSDIKWVKNLLKEWNDLALIKECIAPEGSTRQNHRQDQSLLSILYYKYHNIYNFKIIDKFINFTVQNDVR